MSVNFSKKRGSVESLNVCTRWGVRPCAAQIRCTERRLTPVAGQGPARPVRRLAGRCGERQIDDLPDRLARQRSLAGWPRLVAQEAIHAFMHEPLLPTPDDRFDRPERRTISSVPQSSAVARITR